MAAIVVHAKERKTRLRDVDQEESIGMASREANGTVRGARRDVRDIIVDNDIGSLR